MHGVWVIQGNSMDRLIFQHDVCDLCYFSWFYTETPSHVVSRCDTPNKELPVSIVETFNETSKAKLFINVNGRLIQQSVLISTISH